MQHPNPNTPDPNNPNPNNPNPNNPDPNNPNPNPNNGGGGNPATDVPELTESEMLEGIMQQLGGLPSQREDAPEMDAVQSAILDNQFRQDAERAFDKLQEAIKSEVPDATNSQIHEIGMAFMKRDVNAGIKAMKQALRQEQEVDEKNQEQNNLHVEGGAGGNTSGNNEESGGLASVFNKMKNTYSSPGSRSSI